METTTRYEGTRFGNALEILRWKAYEQENDITYKRAIDDVNEYWEEEIVEYYNRLAKLVFKEHMKPGFVYILLNVKSNAWLIINRERVGTAVYG